MALGDARRESGRAMEKSRRAIGANNEKARRAIGRNNEEARRNIGTAMEASRRGETLQRDLNSLETAPRKRQALSRVEQRGARPVTRGRGTVTLLPAAGSGGGGIASPLTEKTKEEGGWIVPDRPTYDEVSIPTSDGLFTFIATPIQTLKFTDANGFDSEFNLAPPSAPIPP